MKKAFVLFLLLLLPLTTAQVFVPQDYFYENESPDVTSEKWVVDGTAYKVYYFDGKPAFLVKNGTPIADNDTIAYVVEAHYRELYPISEDVVEDIRQLLIRFNESRFDNDNAYRMEEQRCRDNLGESVTKSMPKQVLERTINGPGFGGDIYKFYAALIIGNDLVPPGYSEEYVAEQIRYYFTNSDALSAAIAEALSTLPLLTSREDVVDAAQRLMDLVEEIRQRTTNLERARVLGINDRDICGAEGCLYLCAPPNYDHEALDQLEQIVRNVYEVAQNYGKWREVASSIYNETNSRLLYVFNTHETARVKKALRPLDEMWREDKREITDLLTVVRDDALISYVNSIDELRQDIERSIQEENFTGIDEKIQNLTQLIDKAKARYLAVKQLYEETINYKELSNVLEKLIENKEAVGDLLAKKAELDRNFLPPIPYASLRSFHDQYKQVLDGLKEYYVQEEKNKGSLLLSLKKFIGGAADGWYALSKLIPILPKDVAMPTTVLLSVSSFFTVVFLGSLVYSAFYRRLSRRKYLYFTALVVVALLIGGVSAVAYFPVSAFTHITDPVLFADYLQKVDNVTLVVKLGSSYDNAILSCAQETRKELEAMGLNVHYWKVIGDQCDQDGVSVAREHCVPPSPYILYEPGTPSMEGSLVGEVHFIVRGNEQTFKRCELKHYLALFNQIRGVEE